MHTLLIDAGNTRIKIWELTENLEEVAHHVFNDVDTADEFIKGSDFSESLVSSTRKSWRPDPRLHYFNALSPSPLKVEYDTPDTLGPDRLIGALGARHLYPERNILLIDMGSCITYDIITAESQYLGGTISPGLSMRFRAMHAFTDGLPLIENDFSVPLLGKSTITSLQSGVLYGVLGEMEHIIEQHQQEFENLVVIITGGDADFFESKINHTIFAVSKISLIGLKEAFSFGRR